MALQKNDTPASDVLEGKTGSDNFDVVGEIAELHWVQQSARSDGNRPKRAGELPIKRDVLRQLVRFVTYIHFYTIQFTTA